MMAANEQQPRAQLGLADLVASEWGQAPAPDLTAAQRAQNEAWAAALEAEWLAIPAEQRAQMQAAMDAMQAIDAA